MLIQGERIRAATGKESLIVACEETIRYASKKAGYHGGASDLEVVIPLAVLDIPSFAPDELPPDLKAIPAVKPGSRHLNHQERS